MSFTARLGYTGVVLVFAACAMTIGTASAQAEIFGTVRGIVHDPQHRPIPGATVDLKAQRSDWLERQQTNDSGEFAFNAVPLGEYIAMVANFQRAEQNCRR